MFPSRGPHTLKFYKRSGETEEVAEAMNVELVGPLATRVLRYELGGKAVVRDVGAEELDSVRVDGGPKSYLRAPE